MRAAIVIFALLPGLAWANTVSFSAVNRLAIAPISAAVFEVVARPGRIGARDYWCAAGDYGLSLGLRSNTRVYLAKPEGPSQANTGRKAVQFTFDPSAAGVTPVAPQISLSVDVVGDNMSLVAAQQFCGNTGILGF